MESAKSRAILYADIFDYPLTEAELEKWKIANRELGIKNYELGIKKTNGYYYLKGREKIVALRKGREEISKNRVKIAKKVALLLKKVPLIKMVALTGGLAIQNSKREDDIDFLIVAQRGTLWLTRLLSILLLDLKGLRRRPGDKNFKDKICLNMFLDDGYLTLPLAEQDLYGAHEVYQIKPLYERDETYLRFLRANSWAKKFLPKAIIRIRNQESRIRRGQEKPLFIIHYSLFILERLAKFLQLWYMNMKRRRTTEVILPHTLRFHPKDYRLIVLKEYQKRLRQYG